MSQRGTTLTVDADFGSRIRQLRENNGWSREGLAQRLKSIDSNGQGLSSRTIARIESAQQNIFRRRSLQLLAQVLHQELDDLLNPFFTDASDDPLFQLFQLQFRTLETDYDLQLDRYQRLIDDLRQVSSSQHTDLIGDYYQALLTHHQNDPTSALQMLAKLHQELQSQPMPSDCTPHSRLKMLEQVNFRLGYFLEQSSDYIQAELYYRQAQSVSQALDDVEGVANGYLLSGLLAYHQSSWTQALETWQQGLQLSDCPLFFQARLRNLIGQAHKQMQQYLAAEQAFHDSISLYQSLLLATDDCQLPLRLAEKVPFRLAEAQTNLTALYLETARLEAAETINQQVVAHLTDYLSSQPNHRQMRSFLDLAHYQQAQLLLAYKQTEASRQLLSQLLEESNDSLMEHPWIKPEAQELLRSLP